MLPSAVVSEHARVQVIDYENTSAVLLPLVAASYVVHACGRALWAAYKVYEAERAKGRFGTLPELHANSSGLKALCTEATANGIEAARRACGGHGYSALSGLPALFASYVQNVTWEGDNSVLLLQTGRFIIKSGLSVAAGQPSSALPASAAYMAARPEGPVQVGSQGWIKALFEALARHLVKRAAQDILQHPDSGASHACALQHLSQHLSQHAQLLCTAAQAERCSV
jgi:acyl-CoA oxidase